VTINTAIITGTGLYNLPNIILNDQESINTPYGEVHFRVGRCKTTKIVFIARHGINHTLAPSQINFRANIYALHKMGVKRILATSVCGSLNAFWPPGTLLILDQFINFTAGRADTFYPMEGKLAHIDLTEPYCPTLKNQLIACAKISKIKLIPHGTYACTNGPRFESFAEIKMIKRLGGELVGHTNYPECVLSRELSICYASVVVVSNLAAGVAQTKLTAKEVSENLSDSVEKIDKLFTTLIDRYPSPEECSCHHSLDHAFL
jgi:5'-methylthioadenosine phosphorylase